MDANESHEFQLVQVIVSIFEKSKELALEIGRVGRVLSQKSGKSREFLSVLLAALATAALFDGGGEDGGVLLHTLGE